MHINAGNPLTEFLRELFKAVDQMKSGVFFVVTKDNRSFRLSLLDGEITHSSCGRLHGEEALSTITADSCERVAFSENKMSFFKDRDVVDHAVAFQYLFSLLEEAGDDEISPKNSVEQPAEMKPAGMYRGRTITRPQNSNHSDQSSEQKPAKTERWYRGQRIS